jgi:hypothetical protein
MTDFYIYLAEKRIKEIERQKKIEQYYKKKEESGGGSSPSRKIVWIELLLQTPIDDYRKNAVALIIAPYLINIKRLPYYDAMTVVKEWLARCDQVRRLDSNFDQRIKSSLDVAIRDKTKPMRLSTLQGRNPTLCQRLLRNKSF